MISIVTVATQGDGPDVDALLAGSVEFTATLLNEVMNRIEAKVLRWGPTSQAVAEPKELR